MGSWDEFEKGLDEFGKGLALVALAGVAGSWLDENFDDFKKEAARWSTPPNEFLMAIMARGLQSAQLVSDEAIAEILSLVAEAEAAGDEKPQRASWCEEHNNYAVNCADEHREPVSKSSDWSKEDDDAEDLCPNEPRCEHSDLVHNTDGECQLCACGSNPAAQTAEIPLPRKEGGLYGNI